MLIAAERVSYLPPFSTSWARAKKMTIETLAEMSQQEFLAIKKQMATKDDLQAVAKAILDAIDNLSGQVADVKQRTLSAIDFVRLEERVDVIEKKLGITR
jgi:hypothetical protein